MIEIARKKPSVSESHINEVIERYGLQGIASAEKNNVDVNRPNNLSGSTRTVSRAGIEKLFRDEVRTLEASMKKKAPIEGFQEDRRTLGSLIYEFEHNALLRKVEISKERFVNNIRNTLNHPNLGGFSDDRIISRGLDSIRALIRRLRARGEDK